MQQQAIIVTEIDTYKIFLVKKSVHNWDNGRRSVS
jgi:hypothetical protein